MSMTVDHFLNSISSSTQVVTIDNTGAVLMPKGNTAARPGTPVTGMIRYNVSTDELELYKASGWVSVVSGLVVGNDVAFAIVFGG